VLLQKLGPAAFFIYEEFSLDLEDGLKEMTDGCSTPMANWFGLWQIVVGFSKCVGGCSIGGQVLADAVHALVERLGVDLAVVCS
jgi:hypothetical protein